MPKRELTGQKKQAKNEAKQRAIPKEIGPLSQEFNARDISPYLLGDTPFSPPVQSHSIILSSATSHEARAAIAHQLQQTYGNKYVQSLFNSIELQTKLTAQSIQRVEGEDIYEGEETEDIYAGMEPSTEVPDLTQGTVDKVRLAIINVRLQDAIDLILAEVGDAKMPNLSQCQPPTMEYDPAAEGYAGRTSCAYYPEDNTVESIRVTLGKKAFDTTAYLYSTMMHEYQHVNQYLSDPRGTKEVPGMSDFIAYSWEIYHASETGLINQPNKLTHRGSLLKTMGYDRMSALEQDENSEVYQHAIKIIQDAIGDPSWQP